MILHEDLRAAREELKRYVESEMGWDAVELRTDQYEGRHDDEPTELELQVTICTEVEDDSESEYKL